MNPKRLMRSELVSEIEALERSVEQLIMREEEHSRAQRLLMDQVQRLEQENAQLREELDRLRRAEQIGSAAVSFGPGSHNAREARKLISHLVREIDSIVALLRT